MIGRCGVLVSVCLLGLSGIGCERGSPKSPTLAEIDPIDEVPGPQTEPDLGNDSSEPTANANFGRAKVTLTVGDHQDLAKLIQQHRGKVVLVDFWAMWCPPCRKKFPHTVALAKERAADGLAVISVALDPADAHAEAEAFLQEHEATFENLRSKRGDDDEAFEQFDIPEMTIPCIRLYDREGQVVHTFTAPNDSVVANAVRELLAK